MDISIITVSYNCKRYIDGCIQSVIAQNFTPFEYIIIDGGSTDGTIDIIRRNQHNISQWITEPDSGIAEAMNKGIKLSSGNWIFFLHSDDYLKDKYSLKKVISCLDASFDIISFRLQFQNKDCIINPKSPRWDWTTYFKTPLYHQATLCHKSLFNSIGLFDTSLKIAMDYDFFLRAYLAGAQTKLCSDYISVMRKTGVSSRLDWSSLRNRFLEERRVHYKNVNKLYMKVIYHIYWSLYLHYRRTKHIIHSSKDK